MDEIEQATRDGGQLGILHRTIPLRWQIGAGIAIAIFALVVVSLPIWPADATWKLMPVNLLAVATAAAGAGPYAGLTGACVILLFYVVRFTTAAAGQNLEWLVPLAIAALAITVLTGWLRQELGRMEREVSGARVMLQGANRRLATVQDNERLRAYYDHVTDLPSRRMVIDRFGQVLSQARRSESLVGLLLLDLNHFKEVNDTAGHDAGDEVLRQIGQRLTTVMRREDTVGRLDSDTFVLLLAGLTEAAGVATAAQKIANVLEEPFVAGSPPQEILISARLGAAVFPQDGHDWDSLYRSAEAAMWLARRPV